MTSADLEAYAERLVQNAHDQDALLAAYNACAASPDQYALFLETVGARSADPMMAAHWLFEAAGVWEQSVGDAQRSAELLVAALEQDPTNSSVGGKLAEMYRSVGDADGLVHMLALRAAALKPLAESGALASDEALTADYTTLLAELSAHYLKPEVVDLSKAAEYMYDAHVATPSDARLLPPLRDLLKRLGRVDETLPLYAQEIALTTDPVLRPHLVAEYMESLELAGDTEGLTAALAVELQNDPTNTALQQRYAATVHARLRAGTVVMPEEAEYAVACLLAGIPSREAGDALADAEMALDLAPHDTAAMDAYVHACAALGIVPTRNRPSMAPVASAQVPSISPTAIESSMNVEGVALDFSPAAPAYQAPAYVPPSSMEAPRQSTAPAAPSSVRPSAPPLTASTQSLGSLNASHAEAERLLHAGDRAGALATYQRILQGAPADAEALSWVEDHLRSTRQYAELRDVLLGALRAGTQDPVELRKTRWRDIAGICESHLRDPDGAIGAWKQLLQLDPSDEGARSVLTRQLERLQRWDELASLLERQALSETDTESRLAMEKRLARIHEEKRNDTLGAADAWARAARLSRGDEGSVERAVALYEKAQRHDLALAVLREQLDNVQGAERSLWVAQLADAHESAEEWSDASVLRLELAEGQGSARAWEDCERVADLAKDYNLAAKAARTRAEIASAPLEVSLWLARAASHLASGGEHADATAVLKLAAEADLQNDEISSLYDARLEAVGDHAARVAHFELRAAAQDDTALRAQTWLRAATLADTRLRDHARASTFYQTAAQTQPSLVAYQWLADSAAAAQNYSEEARLLELALPLTDAADTQHALSVRLATTLSESLGRHGDAATLLKERVALTPDATELMDQLAVVYERDQKFEDALSTVRQRLSLSTANRAEIALNMARLAKVTHSVADQITALEALRAEHRLDHVGLLELADAYREAKLAEKELEALSALEVQLEEGQRPAIALRRASLLTAAGGTQQALDALLPYANTADAGARSAWVKIADEAGMSSSIATALFGWWNELPPSTERTAALEDALARYQSCNDEASALNVARSLLSSADVSAATLSATEGLAARARDNLSLERAQRALVANMHGGERALEFVRQAELRLAAGWDVAECVDHAEQGVLTGNADLPLLLARIAAMLPEAKDRVGVYERQALRANNADDKVEALANASHYALSQGETQRAKSFLDTALALAPTADTCTALELRAQQSDGANAERANVAVLVTALSDAGKGMRDGGAFRSEALRHASELAHSALGDHARAWSLLGESLSSMPSDLNLQALRDLEKKTGDSPAAAQVLGFAMGGVFDAKQSRTLLLERARVQREGLGDAKAAAEDLRAAYDLAPADAALWASLAEALREAQDFRGLVSAYEDRLVRERDTATRQDFARNVARIWADDLNDPREAADAWRRLLRLAPGDAEAQAGLERARGSVVGNPSIPPPASLRVRTAPTNLESLRITPPAPLYEPLASTDVLPEAPASQASGHEPSSAQAPAPAVASEDIQLEELDAGEELEELDDLEVIEG